METEEDTAADLGAMGVVTVGDLLGTAARAFGENILAFLGISVLVTFPGVAANVALQEWVQHQQRAAQLNPYSVDETLDLAMVSFMGILAAFFLQRALTFLAHGVMVHATVEFMAGRKARMGASLAAGLSHAGVVLALSLLNTMAIYAGAFLCIVPGVILACVLYASVPAAVVERLGPIEAMQRSADLTTGHRLTIFLVLFVIFMVELTLGCTVNLTIAGGVGLSESPEAMSLSLRILSYGLNWIISIFVTMFGAAAAGVFYARIRGIRDGIDAEEIAEVFA